MQMMARRFRSYLVMALVPLLTGSAGAEPPAQQRQQELIHILRHDCGACHGMTLRGGLGPALTTEALADKPHGLLYNTIMLGRDNTAMPPWRDLLSAEEIDWLVNRLLQGGQTDDPDEVSLD